MQILIKIQDLNPNPSLDLDSKSDQIAELLQFIEFSYEKKKEKIFASNFVLSYAI